MLFFKMQGLGNDYVYIDCTKTNEPKQPDKLAKQISNRHFGIGADGLILICNSKIADLKMRMFNKDGSEAQMCGNGIRCVAKLAYQLGLIKNDTILIETLSGIKKLKLNFVDEKIDTVEVDMGEPIFTPEKIPINILKQTKIQGKKIQIPIKINNKTYNFNCVSMGNPHAVTFVENVQEFPVEQYGEIIEKHEAFPEKTNVEFVQIIDKQKIKMRVWERGTGETLACGTGACAAVIISSLNQYTSQKVLVELQGGNLTIEWKKDNHVCMTGPAVTVFKGEWIDE